MITKEDNEKKMISEYVILFTQAKKHLHSNNIDLALNSFEKCASMIAHVQNASDKICESNFYTGLCAYRKNIINKSLAHFQIANSLIDNTNQTKTFSFHKLKGKIISYLIHTQCSLGNFNECLNYITNSFSYIETQYKFLEKLEIFRYFIKNLLYPIKKTKKLNAFLIEYETEQNNVVYNNTKGISLKLKQSFSTLMNIQTKTILFDKYNSAFIVNQYGVNINHPFNVYLNKNMNVFEEGVLIPKIKNGFETHLKSSKIKVEKEFQGKFVGELLAEIKRRYDEFHKVFITLSNLFAQLFKANFKVINSENKDDNQKLKVIKSNASPQKYNSNSQRSFKLKPNTPFTPKIALVNRRETRTISKKEKQNVVILSSSPIKVGNSSSKINKNRNQTSSNLPSNSITYENKQEFPILKLKSSQESLPIIPTHQRNHSNITEKTLKLTPFNESPHSLKSNETTYDSSRVRNKSFYISYPPNNEIQRSINLFLFKILVEEFQKNQKVRDIDLCKSKTQNYVASFSKTSKMGYHIRIGESINVNQDVAFIYENFLLIQNFFLFGVCDGHGQCGELVANYAKEYIPAYIQYIEMDNFLTKRNRNIHNIITSLYSISEKSNVRDMNIIKYFSEKFGINFNDISFVKSNSNFNEISQNIKEAFYNANNDLSKQKYDSNESGCTVCMVFLLGSKLICANVGDSRAIICSYYNNVWTSSQLTNDHKPSEKNERKRIESKGGIVERCKHEENGKEYGPYRVWFQDTTQGPGLAMSRSFGDYSAKPIGVVSEPDVFEYKIENKDKFIVVGSDGVWEYLSNKNVMDIIAEIYINKGTAVEAGEKVVKIARSKWKSNSSKTIDDITCVVLFLKSSM